MSRNVQQNSNIFSFLSVGRSININIKGAGRLLYYQIISMCRYAQSCAFISVIELPRIPAYCPKNVSSVFGHYYYVFSYPVASEDGYAGQIPYLRGFPDHFNTKFFNSSLFFT